MVVEENTLSVPRSWAVVNTQPHRERTALENLARQGFEVYSPLIRKCIRHGRQMRDVLRPLFPGYLFVRLSPHSQRWRPILSTLGVRTLVCFGEQPACLENGFIQALKLREIDGVIVRPPSPYAIGQQVRFATGPFDGVVAKIIEMGEKDRLVVLIDILNQPVRVKIVARQLAPG